MEPIFQPVGVTNTAWVTFDNGGVWKVPNVETATAGSGTSGSVPAGAVKVTGGSLPTGNERCGPIAVDPFDGTVWVIQHASAASQPARIHRLPQGAGVWKEEVSREIQEGAGLAQYLAMSAGFGIIPTSGQGLLRRVC